MNKLNINNYPDNLVSFNSYYLESSEVIWFDHEELYAVSDEKWTNKRFKNTFSYIVSEGWISKNSLINHERIKTQYAERYGSYGLGGNGGGARCGNIENFQLKGIGKTHLLVQKMIGMHMVALA